MGEKYLINIHDFSKSDHVSFFIFLFFVVVKTSFKFKAYNEALKIDHGNLEALYNSCLCKYYNGKYNEFKICLKKFKAYLIETKQENLIDLKSIDEKFNNLFL